MDAALCWLTPPAEASLYPLLLAGDSLVLRCPEVIPDPEGLFMLRIFGLSTDILVRPPESPSSFPTPPRSLPPQASEPPVLLLDFIAGDDFGLCLALASWIFRLVIIMSCSVSRAEGCSPCIAWCSPVFSLTS